METLSKRATAKVASKTNDQELAREAGGVSSSRGGEILLSLTERKKVELGSLTFLEKNLCFYIEHRYSSSEEWRPVEVLSNFEK